MRVFCHRSIKLLAELGREAEKPEKSIKPARSLYVAQDCGLAEIVLRMWMYQTSASLIVGLAHAGRILKKENGKDVLVNYLPIQASWVCMPSIVAPGEVIKESADISIFGTYLIDNDNIFSMLPGKYTAELGIEYVYYQTREADRDIYSKNKLYATARCEFTVREATEEEESIMHTVSDIDKLANRRTNPETQKLSLLLDLLKRNTLSDVVKRRIISAITNVFDRDLTKMQRIEIVREALKMDNSHLVESSIADVTVDIPEREELIQMIVDGSIMPGEKIKEEHVKYNAEVLKYIRDKKLKDGSEKK